MPSALTAASSNLYFTAPGATLWEWQATTPTTPTISWADAGGDRLRHGAVAAQLDATASVPGTLHLQPGGGYGPGGRHRHAVGDLHPHGHDGLHDASTATDTIVVAQATPAVTWAQPGGDHLRDGAVASPQLDARPACRGRSPTPRRPARSRAPGPRPSRSPSPPPTPPTTRASPRPTTLAVAQATPTVNWAQPGGDHVRDGAAATPSSTRRRASRAPSPTRRRRAPMPGAGTRHPVGDLHPHRLDRLPTVDRDRRRSPWRRRHRRSPGPTRRGSSTARRSATRAARRHGERPGTFTYTPAAGHGARRAGTHTLSVTFTPHRLDRLHDRDGDRRRSRAQATPTSTWSNPGGHRLRHGPGVAQLDATSSVPGTFTYIPAAGTVLGGQAPRPCRSPSPPPTPPTTPSRRRRPSTSLSAQATPTITWASPTGIATARRCQSSQLECDARPGDVHVQPGRRDGPRGRVGHAVGDLHPHGFDRLQRCRPRRDIAVAQAT